MNTNRLKALGLSSLAIVACDTNPELPFAPASGEHRLDPAGSVIEVPVGPDTEVPSAVVVEQGGEDAWRVETRTAELIDCSVGTDQGCRLQVADQTMRANVGVAIHRNVLSHRSGSCSPLCITPPRVGPSEVVSHPPAVDIT